MKTLLLLVLFSILSCGKHNSSGVAPVTNPLMASYGTLLNQHRAKLNLAPVTFLGEIESVARPHSQEMARKTRRFGHGGWKTRCEELRTKLKARACGELVATGPKTPWSVLNSWLESTPHRESLEQSQWTHSGIALETSESGDTFWTQILIQL